MESVIQCLDDQDGFEYLFRQIEAKAAGKLSPGDREKIRMRMRAKKLRRRQYLLQEGDTCRSKGFLVCGAARIFSVDEKGLEHNIGLYTEGNWIMDYESFHCQTGSKYNIEMLENSQLLLLNFTDYSNMIAELPLVRQALRTMELEQHVSCLRRLHTAISLSAQERYEELRRDNPAFVHRFPQSMIASFLGISAETLCRIRRQGRPLLH